MEWWPIEHRIIRCGLTLVAPFLAAIPSLPRVLEAQDSIRTQWEHSPHAGSMDTAAEGERMNRTGCAHCHTAQGFHEVTLAGETSSAPYDEAEGLTCRACHLPGDGAVRVGPIRTGSPRDLCRGCHAELVVSNAEELSWCSQWGLYVGSGGAEVPGMEYPVSAHSTFQDGCVTCHMAPVATGLDPMRVGGHTFRVKTKGEDPLLFNPEPCRPCHGDITLEWLSESQAEVRSLLDTLAEILPRKPVPGDPHTDEPRYPADPSLDEATARASHNYWLVLKDGSFGIHNPGYTRALLERSIAELRSPGAPQPEVSPS